MSDFNCKVLLFLIKKSATKMNANTYSLIQVEQACLGSIDRFYCSKYPRPKEIIFLIKLIADPEN